MRLRDLGLVFLGLGLGCSTLEPKTEPTRCTNTADCAAEPDTVCQFGFCLPAGNTPPSVYVGFDLREGSEFRVEVAGCDKELTSSQSSGVRALEVPRPQLTMQLDLRVFRTLPEDPNNPTLEEMLPARLVLTQGSRFARDRVETPLDAPTIEGEDTVVPTSFLWPRYHPANEIPELPEPLQPMGHILWRIEPLQDPESDELPSAPRYINLTPPIADGLLPEEDPAGENPIQTCIVDDAECCPAEMPMCEQETVENACVPADLELIDGVTSGVCRRQALPLFSYDHEYDRTCDRVVTARIGRTAPGSTVPTTNIVGAQLGLRHADTGQNRVGLAALAVLREDQRPAQCMRNDACVEDLQFCNMETNQCEVNLNGLRAASGTTDEMDPDRVTTRVFTYCEDEEGNAPLDRSYTVRIDSPPETGLPPVNYNVDVTFDPFQESDPDADADLGGGKAFCIPDWGAPSDVRVELFGQPQTLLTVAGEDYECCSVDCLPSEDDPDPPPAPSSCKGTGQGASAPTVDASTTLVVTEAELALYMAEDSECVPPSTDAEGVVSTLTRVAECGGEDDPDFCVFASLPGSPDQPRTYTVRVTPPTGSVLGSTEVTLEVAEPLAEPPRIELPQREIVFGQVTLDPEVCGVDPDDWDPAICGSEGATVLAERLRVGNQDESNTPGPYFHEVKTFSIPDAGDGHYVLPLDAGWWVMTALPDAGTAGGPAKIELVQVIGGAGRIEQGFTLEQGILVTIDVDGFDRRSTVLPLDIGSWRFDTNLIHPDRAGEVEPGDRLLDLMRPGECLTESGDGTAACQIRRLISGTSLSPSQVGQVRFSARDVGKTAATVCQAGVAE